MESNSEKLAKIVPPSKLIVGFGNYGYDWIIGGQGGKEVAFGDVMAAAAETKQGIQWDLHSDNPVLRYRVNGQSHEVWFLDAVTALNHVLAAHDKDFRGLGLWRLGAEDPGLWHVLEGGLWPLDHFNTSALTTLAADQRAPRHYGKGEILHVREMPQAGERTVSAPPSDGAITAHTIIMEVGPDISRFGNASAFAAWLGLCPEKEISGGKVLSTRSRKVKNRAAIALRLGAHCLHHVKNYLGDFHRKMKWQLGAPEALPPPLTNWLASFITFCGQLNRRTLCRLGAD